MARAALAYDQADYVLESWARTYPGLDLSSQDVTLRIHQLSELLQQRTAPLMDRFKLKPSLFELLAELRRCGLAFVCSPGELTERLAMSSGGMSNLLDRAEDQGLIVRLRDPNDGRGVLVRLTQAGQETIEAVMLHRAQQDQALLTHLSRRDRATLADLLRKLTLAAEATTQN